MRFYILDDDSSIVQMLYNLIEDLDLGEVLKTETDPFKALKDIDILNIDILLVDYLMPGIDGGSFIKKVNAINPDIDCIMVSQVDDKNMVSQAYENGAVIFLHKPINTVEFKRIITTIIEKRHMAQKLSQIAEFFNDDSVMQSAASSASVRQKFVRLFTELGIPAEKGTPHLIDICTALYALDTIRESDFNYALNSFESSAKTVGQRMRRAISKACHHLAGIGLVDYHNEHFQNYAFLLFDPQSIQDEFAYIKGQTSSGGKVNLYHFIVACVMSVK